MISFLVVIILILMFIHFSWKWWKTSFNLDFISSLGSIPWIGTVMDNENLYVNLKDFYEKFDHRFRFWFGPIPFVFTGNAYDIKDILRSTKQLSKSSIIRLIIEPWVGDSVFMASPQKWQSRRKLVSPAFHTGTLKEYARVFESYAKKMNEDIKALTKGGSKSIDVQPLMGKWTMFIINKTAMDVDVDENDSECMKYMEALAVLKTKIMERWARPYLLPDFMFRLSTHGKEFYHSREIMNRFIVKVINRKIADRMDDPHCKKNNHRSFLDVILDGYDANLVDLKGILDEVNTYMFSGHDTTSCAMDWMLYQIGLHPDVQEKIYKAIEGRIDVETDDLFTKYGNIEYLDMVIKESLRLHSPIIVYHRLLTDDTMIGGRLYKKGVEFGISPQAVHHNEKYWPDHERFDPERFSAENVTKQTPFSFIPFSAGSRNCVGQKFAMWEMRILLFQIVSVYRVKTCPQKPEVAFDVVRTSRNGLWIQFEER